MAKKIVENQQLMSAARAAINDNFTELYDQAASSGGSSGSATLSGGGIGSLDYIKNLYATGDVRLRFTETLPDAIVAKDGDSLGDYWDQVLRFKDIGISGGQLQVYYGRDEYTIWFDLNTPSGDYINDASVDEDEVKPPDASLKDYIDEGRALYYGGTSTGGSATGDDTSGGIGSHSIISSRNNTGIPLPDYIIVNWNNDDTPLSLAFIDDDHIWYESAAGNYRFLKHFNNNKTADDYGTSTGTYLPDSGSWPITGWDTSASLKDYVDAGKVGYYGGGSGSSSSGGGSSYPAILKQNQGDFYTELPDAIIAKAVTGSTDGRYLICRLMWINPIGSTWQVVYRQEDYGDESVSSDIYIMFKLDADGTFVEHGSSVNQSHSDNDQNLKWFIENDRAIHYGKGSSSSGATSSTLSYKGAFASGTNYILNDVVTFNGKSYVALSPTTGVIDPEGYGASAYENDGTVLDNEWAIFSNNSLNLIDDKLYVAGTPNVASVYVNRFITVVPGTRYYVTADVDSTNGPGLLVIDYQAGSWGAGSNTHEADHNFFESSGKISGYITPTGNSIYFGIRPGNASTSTGSFYNIRVAATYPVEMANPWSLLAGEIVMDGEIVGGSSSSGGASSGGIGSLSIIKQKAGNFYTDIPDAIVGTLSDGNVCILRLKFAGYGNSIHYEARHGASADNDYVMSFNTDLSGSYTAPTYTNNYYPWLADRSMDQNLRWFIENGRALYSGGSSSSSGGSSSDGGSSGGAGSLQVIKDKSNFYTDLPDAIVWPHTPINIAATSRAESILHLRFVHSEGTSPGLDIFYESRDIGNGGAYLGFTFKNNADGEYNTLYSNNAGFQDIPDSNVHSLRWFIENNRAIYYGGGSSGSSSGGTSSGGSSNFYGANIFLTAGTLTIKSQTSDFIESVDRVGSSNNYDITFKTGIFTEPPIMVSSTINTSDTYLETVHVKSDTTTGSDYASGNKITIRWEMSNHNVSYTSSVIENVGANLIFMKSGDDFASGSSSGGSSSNSPGIKAWGVFDGTGTTNTGMTLKGGSNVTSVLKTGTGVYKVTMTNPMPSEHYSVSVDCNPNGYQGAYGGVRDVYNNDSSAPTTTIFYIDCRATTNAQVNPNRVTFHVVC